MRYLTQRQFRTYSRNPYLCAAIAERRNGSRRLDDLELEAVRRLAIHMWGDRDRAAAFVRARVEYARAWAAANHEAWYGSARFAALEQQCRMERVYWESYNGPRGWDER